MDGNRTYACEEKDDEQSLTQWKFKIPKMEKPNRSYFRKWRQFVAWLRTQEATTKIDFGNIAKANGKHKIIK